MAITNEDKNYSRWYIKYAIATLERNESIIKKFGNINEFVSKETNFKSYTLDRGIQKSFVKAFKDRFTTKKTLEHLHCLLKLDKSYLEFCYEVNDSNPIYLEFVGNEIGLIIRNTLPKKVLKLLKQVPLSKSLKESVNANNFYNGHAPSWEDLHADFDIQRSCYSGKLGIKNILLSTIDKISHINFFIIKGVAGSGKSTLMKRIAFDVGQMYSSVFYINTEFDFKEDLTKLEQELLFLFNELRDKPVVFVIDGFYKLLYYKLINFKKIQEEYINSKILFILSDSNINLSQAQSENNFLSSHLTQILPIDLLTDIEINQLIDKIDYLEIEAKLEKSERTISFQQIKELCRESYGRQLLVAMLQIRKGMRFSEIIENECKILEKNKSLQFICNAYIFICLFQHYGLKIYDDLLFHALNKNIIQGVKELTIFSESVTKESSTSVGLLIYHNEYLYSRHFLISEEVFKHYFIKMVGHIPVLKSKIIKTFFNAIFDSKFHAKDPNYLDYVKKMFPNKRSLDYLSKVLPKDCLEALYLNFEKINLKDKNFRLNYLCSVGVVEQDATKATKIFKYVIENIKEDPFAYCQLGFLALGGGRIDEAKSYALRAKENAFAEVSKMMVVKLMLRLDMDTCKPMLNELQKSTDPKIRDESISLLKELTKKGSNKPQ